jgi:hypothetical protein
MFIQNEREEGEVTDDEEEYLPVPQKRRADEIVTVTPNIEDLRLAVFRSVVQRKLTEKKVDTNSAFSSFFTKTEYVKEFDENDGSSSDMEVETWDSNVDAALQVECRPEALKASDSVVCEAETSSVPTAVDENSRNLDCESSMMISERKKVFSVVFHFKESEQLDSFGLGLKEQMKRKKAKNLVPNSAVIENQRLAASFSFWSADTPTAGNNKGDRSANSGSTAPVGSMDISSLAALPIECVSSVGAASSSKSATVSHTQSRTAEIRSSPEDSLGIVEISSVPLTAAQQRMKMVEDIARLKLEILLREKKNKAKDKGATFDDSAKLSRARAQASRISASHSTPALLPIGSDNRGAKMPLQTKISDNSGLLPVPKSGPNVAASSQSRPSIPPSARKSQTTPSVQSQGQTEEALRAAALVSRKKRRREEIAPLHTEDETGERNSPSLHVAASLLAPVPIPIPVHIPVPVRVQHTLYPSSRTRLGFSLYGTEHIPLAAALPSPPLPPSSSPKVQISSTAPSISSSSTFGQNRRYVPTRTSCEDPPSTTALYSTLMDIGVGLRVPSGSSGPRVSSKRLTLEGQRKGREGSLKTKMSTKMKIADDLQNNQSNHNTLMDEERYSHSTGTWIGSGTSSSNHNRRLPILPPGRIENGALTEASSGHGRGEVDTPVPSGAGPYGAGDSDELDYSYGQHDAPSLYQQLSTPEERLEDWYVPPDLGPQSRQGAASSRPRPPLVVLPPPPPPLQPHLSEDFILRVRRLKQQKLKSSNTVGSISTDSELEFGEILETVRSTDSYLVTPRDPPSCPSGDSDTDMSVDKEIAVEAEEEEEVEVGEGSHNTDHPAAQQGRILVVEGHTPVSSVEAAAEDICGPVGMVGVQCERSCGSSEGTKLIETIDITSYVGDIIPASARDTQSPVASDRPDILVRDNSNNIVQTAVTEAALPIPIPMSATNTSSTSSASATEMRALKLREAELKVRRWM